MFLLQAQNWPIFFICLAMLASAVIDWWKFKVPNVLTMPVIVLGWVFGFLHWPLGIHIVPGDGVGGIGAALAGTAVGSLLLLAYMVGGMGAGDVKMCMGFGAWIGAFYGITPGEPGTAEGDAIWIILKAQCAGILVGGVMGIIMILLRMEFRKNVEHARSIVMDAVTTGSIGKMAERANERRPRWHRLPYGVPMCIGFLGYLLMVEPALPKPDGEQSRLAPASAPAHAASLAYLDCARPLGRSCRDCETGATDSSLIGCKRVEVVTAMRSKLTSERSGAVLSQVIQSQGSKPSRLGALSASQRGLSGERKKSG